MIRSLAPAVVVALLGLHSAADAATYNFFDTTFVNSNWIGTKFADTSTPTGSFAAGTTNPGGSTLSPGPATADYREITHNFGGPGAGAINVTHQGVLYNWTPALGETATSINYSYDLKFFDPTSNNSFGAVGFSPAIFQGGAVFRLAAYDDVYGAGGWQRFGGTAIPISAFFKMDPTTAGLTAGSVNAAAAMSFGFVSANSANQSATKTSGIDDFGIQLRTTPEPATLAALSLAGTMFRRRRRAM